MPSSASSRRVRLMIDGVSARSGGGRRLLAEQIAALDRVGWFDLEVWASRELAADLLLTSPRTRVISVAPRPLVVRLLWEQTYLAWRARRAEVAYLPANFALFLCSRPQVLGVQNANHFGDAARNVRRTRFSLRWRVRFGIEALVARASVRRTERVVAVSAALRDAVLEDVTPRAEIAVIQSATPSLPVVDVPAVPDRYVLSVANDYPHKDWDGLIEAFLVNVDLDRLILVGDATASRRRQLQQRIDGHGTPARVYLAGAITDRQALAALYANATGFVAHSLLESFGLTPLEAQAAGLPVAAADLPAHREVCGRDAIYYQPECAAALVAAIRALRREAPSCVPHLRRRTWEDNARELGGIIRDLTEPRTPRP